MTTAQINGQTVTARAGTFTRESAIGRRSTMDVEVRTAAPTYFLEDSQIEIQDQNGNTIFTGYLSTPKYGKPGYQKALYHKLSAVDQHRLADKRRIAANFVGGYTGAYIARYLLSTILAAEGVTEGMIYDGATCGPSLICGPTTLCGPSVGAIPAITFDYCSVAEALDQIVQKISSGGIPYYWQIDQDKALYLVPYDAIPADPVDGSQIDEVKNPPEVTRSNPLYRNNQIVKGVVAQTVTQNETRKGDGATQSWPMRYALAQAPTITVNSVAKTVGIRGVDSGKDWYWSAGEFEVTQDSTGTILTTSDTLAVVYIGQYKTTVIASNDAQIALEASIDGTSGIVDEVEDISLPSLDAGLQVAGAYLNRYAVQSPPAITFNTLQDDFAPGQYRVFNLTDWGLNNVPMLIESVTASDQIDGINVRYDVTAISGPSDSNWTAFWGGIVGSGSATDSSTGTTTIVSIASSFSVGVNVGAVMSPVVHACPICGPSTLCGGGTIVC